MNDGNDKSDIGKMAGGTETSPSFRQASTDGPWIGSESRQTRQIDNHQQEVWKTPLPQFIEDIYFKRFKREEPETVKPLKQIMAEMEVKKKQQKAKKEERRKQRALSSGSEE